MAIFFVRVVLPIPVTSNWDHSYQFAYILPGNPCNIMYGISNYKLVDIPMKFVQWSCMTLKLTA